MIELRPNVFVLKHGDVVEVLTLPDDSYRNIIGDWFLMSKIGDRTICKQGIDIIDVVLDERCAHLFTNGKIKTEEGNIATKEYQNYTGKEWTFQRFVKRST